MKLEISLHSPSRIATKNKEQRRERERGHDGYPGAHPGRAAGNAAPVVTRETGFTSGFLGRPLPSPLLPSSAPFSLSPQSPTPPYVAKIRLRTRRDGSVEFEKSDNDIAAK